MVILNKIYTKTGDSGETALGNGARVAKFSLRVEAYGTVDELNSHVGVSRLHSEGKMDEALMGIQNDLFDLGADLCRPNFEKDKDEEYPPLRIVPAQVNRLENEIDQMNEDLEPLKSFILPGGSTLAAHLHVCRTVARRAERLSFELATMEEINPSSIKFLNRLSDWFFVAARLANNNGLDDVLWVPGANR
ncbi:MAG: cob(I)yrinic acid a,c-diamide adenosyltransferase [Rhodobacteraceae bacterium]|nr:cob(I)yrinic acid a,c-diamide adenosyltransferase [Paracoccaceae bacterium]